jgi:hypothetical protein
LQAASQCRAASALQGFPDTITLRANHKPERNAGRDSETPMLEDRLQRRPYNAVTDLIDAQVGRGFGDKIAFAVPIAA